MKTTTPPNRNLALIATTFLILTASTPAQAILQVDTPPGLLVGASAKSDTESGASSAGFGTASCVINGLYQYDIGPPVWSCAGAAGIGGEACFDVLWADFCVSAGGATGSAFGVGVAGADGACETVATVAASDAQARQDNDAGSGLLPLAAPACLAVVGAVGTGVCAEFSAEAGGQSLGGSSSADGEGATAACPDSGGGGGSGTCDNSVPELQCLIDDVIDKKPCTSPSCYGPPEDWLEDWLHVGGGFFQNSNSADAPIGSACYDSWQTGAERMPMTEVLSPEQQNELLSNLKSSLLENLRANKPTLEAPAMLSANSTSTQMGQEAIDAMWLEFEPAVESIVDNAVLDEVFGYMISCE